MSRQTGLKKEYDKVNDPFERFMDEIRKVLKGQPSTLDRRNKLAEELTEAQREYMKSHR